jgi:hypothetical protein
MSQGKKTGGRKRGTPNKNRSELLEAVSETGLTPLEYMLGVMRDPQAEYARRDDMAKAAAPYVHSKMPTAIITPPPGDAPVTEDDEKLLNLYLRGLHAEADEG